MNLVFIGKDKIYTGFKQIYKHFIYGNDFFPWVAAIS